MIVTFLVGGVAVAVAAFAFGRNAAEESFDRLLLGAANDIAGSIELERGEVLVDIPRSAFELLALAPEDRIVYAVYAPDGRLLTGYAEAAPPQDRDLLYFGRFGDDVVRLAAVRRPFAERGFRGEVTIIVGQTMIARDAMARAITERALIAAGLAGLVMSALAIFAARSALGPLRRIERVLAARAPEDLSRIDITAPREVSSLVGTLNRFMARIDRQVTVMRRMIGDASHQLRTPIAALRAQAELAADEEAPERQRAQVVWIHERLVKLSRLTDQLLSYALVIHRADASPHERIDLRAVAIEAVNESDHQILAAKAELRLELPEEPVPCVADSLSLVEAVKNLVVNAFRHGAAPVSVVVGQEGGSAWMGVRDRGEGVPQHLWRDAAARPARDRGVSSESAGFGLSIVRAVAAAHGGKLRFARTSDGAFEAAIVLASAKKAGS